MTASRPSSSSTSAPGLARAGCAAGAAPRRPRSRSGWPGSPISSRHGLHAEDRRAARAWAPRPASGSPIGPERQRSNSSSTLRARPSAHQDVQPVARLDLASSRAAAAPRRRARSRSPARRAGARAGSPCSPTIASDSAHRELEHLGARAGGSCPPRAAAARARARRWSAAARAPAARRSRPGSAWRSSTTKKTMLKNEPAWSTPSITGKVASTIGTAPRSPAQPTSAGLAQAEAARRRVAISAASGRATNISTAAIRSASPTMSPNSRRVDQQAERQEHRDLADPRQAVVEVLDRAPARDGRAAQRQPGEVDGDEARAVQRVGGAEGERRGGDRGHRVEAGGGELRRAGRPSTASRPTARPTSAPMPSSPTASSDHVARRRSRARWMYSMKPSTSTIATGSLKPDSPSSVRARRRSRLDPRSTEKIAALSVRGHDRAQQQALERASGRAARRRPGPRSPR